MPSHWIITRHNDADKVRNTGTRVGSAAETGLPLIWLFRSAEDETVLTNNQARELLP
ncbi:unnamed protein product [Fusarium graminearum]|nr:unnamed protein product [Fusarium graminearum]